MKINSKCQCVSLDLLNPDEFYGHFIFTSLEKGEGTTIGNMLRRTLLSNLYGLRITGVRVPGTNSEFTPLAGVREDLLEIILNLKDIVIYDTKNTGQSCYGRLNSYGPGIITAGALILPNDVKVLNPNAHLLTIADNSLAELEIKIEYGKSYVLAKDQKLEGSTAYIPIDSNFAPVIKVNWYIKRLSQAVENTTEELHLEIFTNGTVLPHQALLQARNVIGYMLSPVTNIEFPCFSSKKIKYQNTDSNSLSNTGIEEEKKMKEITDSNYNLDSEWEEPKKVMTKERSNQKEPKKVMKKEKSNQKEPKEIRKKEKPNQMEPKEIQAKEKPNQMEPKEIQAKEKPNQTEPKKIRKKEKPNQKEPKEIQAKENPNQKEQKKIRKKEKPSPDKPESPEEILLQRIAHMESGSLKGLDLSNRIIKVLNKAGIDYTWELIQYSTPKLRTIAGLGPKSIEEIETKLDIFFEPPI